MKHGFFTAGDARESIAKAFLHRDVERVTTDFAAALDSIEGSTS